MVVATPPRITADALAAMPDGDRFELYHGELVEKEMSSHSVYVGGEIYSYLRDHCKKIDTAYAFTDGLGFTLKAGVDDQIRKPDVSVVLKSRFKDGKVPSLSRFEFSPDLAVEVLSPSDIAFNVEAKIQEYLDAGTQIVWLAKPQTKRITVFRPDGTEVTFGPNDTLTADPVLPGFSMRVGDVFP